MKNEKENTLKEEKKKKITKDAKLDPFLHENHALPKTRRDFMAHGFIGACSSFALPSFLGLVASQNKVFADTVACALPDFTAGLPYLCIDVAGGMNIAGQNVLVGMYSDGEHQEDFGNGPGDYTRLGIAPAEHPSLSGKVESKYGLKFHRTSGILEGMNEVLGDETMPNGKPISEGIDGLVFCTRTSDDSATNPINTVYMANKAGANGQLVQLIGNVSSDTGARSNAPSGQVNLALRPSRVSRNSDAVGLLSLGNTLSGPNFLAADEGQEKIKKFMDRISNMSRSKIRDIASKNSIGQIESVLNCSVGSAKKLFNKFNTSMLDPTNDQAVTKVFADQSQNIASVAKLVLDSIAGAGTISIGGGDYHGGDAMRTHAKDKEVGRAIGRCILLAKEKEKSIAIHLYTDGGVAGDGGGVTQPVAIEGLGQIEKVMWTGDSGTRSSAVLLVYKHNHDGTPLVKENAQGPRRQVGNFVKNGGVNLTTLVGNSTENLWKAIMLNYLAAQGKEGEFENIFGRSSLPQGYEKLIRLKKIVA